MLNLLCAKEITLYFNRVNEYFPSWNNRGSDLLDRR